MFNRTHGLVVIDRARDGDNEGSNAGSSDDQAWDCLLLTVADGRTWCCAKVNASHSDNDCFLKGFSSRLKRCTVILSIWKS